MLLGPLETRTIVNQTLDSVKKMMSMDNVNLAIMRQNMVLAKHMKTIKLTGQTCKPRVTKFGREGNAEKQNVEGS